MGATSLKPTKTKARQIVKKETKHFILIFTVAIVRGTSFISQIPANGYGK